MNFIEILTQQMTGKWFYYLSDIELPFLDRSINVKTFIKIKDFEFNSTDEHDLILCANTIVAINHENIQFYDDFIMPIDEKVLELEEATEKELKIIESLEQRVLLTESKRIHEINGDHL